MIMSRATRGYGLFEGLLAKIRAKKADGLIPLSHRSGRILDIGCGNYPYFLTKTKFSQKYGLDKFCQEHEKGDYASKEIALINHDVDKNQTFPFKNDFFDIISMLAVFEHIEPNNIIITLKEINRILKPGGIYILTTPASWASTILKIMAILKLVSSEEIKEHKDAYTPKKIILLLNEGNFLKENINIGYFELFMNIWVTASK